jgi:hypothetical protein
MAKTKKVAAPPKAKRAYNRKIQKPIPDPNPDMLEIETAPPPPLRGASLEKLEFLDKVDRTLEFVQTGQAFIIPIERRDIVAAHLKRKYADERWPFMKIANNPKSLRVYRLAYNKKK